VRAALPAGAGSCSAAEFESISASAFDPQWVTSLVG
jgi:dethiobiotin synthetase